MPEAKPGTGLWCLSPQVRYLRERFDEAATAPPRGKGSQYSFERANFPHAIGCKQPKARSNFLGGHRARLHKPLSRRLSRKHFPVARLRLFGSFEKSVYDPILIYIAQGQPLRFVVCRNADADQKTKIMQSYQNDNEEGISAKAGSAEERLIARYFRPLAVAQGAFGLGDDAAAVVPPTGCDLVLTTDGVIAGVHFLPDDAPGHIARKVLRMNLSDLAAKGAKPTGFLLSIALPVRTEESWIAAFAAGLGEDAKHYDCPLYGGDTDHTPGPLSISVTAFGTVPSGTIVRRSTAKAGDVVVVSGTIGDAALGLLLRRDLGLAERWRLSVASWNHLRQRYLLPQPRNALAEAVLHHASAAMDVSDGLAGDLGKLCRASGVAAEIEVESVPLSDAARSALEADPKLIETVLTGGDDYEIALTVAAAKLGDFCAAAKAAGVLVSQIGRVTVGEGARFVRAGEPLFLARPSFSHF
jgi:thiamine-monophosphate kinase